MYLRPRVTLTFDLLTPKVDRFLWTTCANLHQNRLNSLFQNIVFTRSVTDERIDARRL